MFGTIRSYLRGRVTNPSAVVKNARNLLTRSSVVYDQHEKISRRQRFDPIYLLGGGGVALELFKIFDGDITIWGMAETPGNGLLHVLFSEFKLMPGVVADGSTDGRIHQNLKHAYSSDNGETWTIQTVSLGSGLEYNLCGLRAIGGNQRVHIFYKTQRTPMNRWGGGSLPGGRGALPVTITNPGIGSLTSATFNIRMIGSVGYGEGTGPAASKTYLFGGSDPIRDDSTVEIIVPGSPEPNVTHVDVYSQQSTPFDEQYADVRRIAQVANPYPGTTTVVGQVNVGGAVINRLWNIRRRARLVHMQTGIDGVSWESGSIAEVDADNLPPLTGTPWTIPTGRRIGLSLETPLSFTASRDIGQYGYQREAMSLAVDENDVKSFLYIFDGFQGDVDITANKIEAVYYKESPSDARFAVKELTAGAAVAIHFRNPEVWRLNDVILAMWRDNPGTNDELWYRSNRGGVWATAAVLWTDTATEFFEGVRLHPSEAGGVIALLMSRDVDGQAWDKLFRRDFNVVSETWGSETEMGTDVPTSEASAARASGSILDDDLHVLVDSTLISPFAGSRDIWYVPPFSGGSERVFGDDENGVDLTPVLDANDFVITIDAPRIVTGRKFFALVEHLQVGSDPILFVDSSGLYVARIELP